MSNTTNTAKNRLANSTSPYLLAHAHQPVKWYEWGDEAFEIAREKQRPIFLSVGYSTCYWCHVMARKVFDKPMIAGLMNELFVNIKVDREQRPDIDEIYITAAQLLTGRGGWPNSVFLTPPGAQGANDTGLKPFWAGTYLPPEPIDRMPSFPQVLGHLGKAWGQKKEDIIAQAEKVSSAMKQVLQHSGDSKKDTSLDTKFAPFAPQDKWLNNAVDGILSLYDKKYGGFGSSMADPKFPQPVFLKALTCAFDNSIASNRSNSPSIEQVLDHTFLAMAQGGIWDQIGHGFHRYSTDSQWLVPHFEKMLYDNGQLLESYALWHERTQDKNVKQVCQTVCGGIVDYLKREMIDDSGLFYSAQDAEVDGKEGENYLWTNEQIDECLEDSYLASLAKKMYGLDNGANFQDPHVKDAKPSNVLYLSKAIESLASEFDKSIEEIQSEKQRIDNALLTARLKRKQPPTDDKILAAWNGMVIVGLAKAGQVLESQEYLDLATNAANGLLEKMVDEDGKLFRMMRQGNYQIDGFLEDYVFVVQALLQLYSATNNQRWLDEAKKLTKLAIAQFKTGKGGYFDSTSGNLFVKPRTARDGAEPSANGRMVLNLIELYEITGDKTYKQRAIDDLASFENEAKSQPIESAQLAIAAAKLAKLSNSTADNSLQINTKIARENGALLVEINLDIADNLHLYAPDSNSEVGAGIALKLSDSTINKGINLSVHYPKAKEKQLELESNIAKIYENSATIKAQITGENLPQSTQLILHYQLCGDSYCLAPDKKVIAI